MQVRIGMHILIKYMFSYSKKTASSEGSSMGADGTVSHQGLPGDSFFFTKQFTPL